MILLIEDNNDIIDGLKFLLEENKYSVTSINNINECIKYLNNNSPELIILDVTLLDGNGFELYEDYISNKKIPTIFLTANDNEEDIVKGLLLADDYITKPFLAKELLVRIKKVLLRNNKESIIKVKDVSFDIENMTVKKNNKDINLTALELNILSLLFINKGNIVSKNIIIDKVWELTGNDIEEHTVNVYMKRIKDKLNSDIIINVKGLGYKLYDGK